MAVVVDYAKKVACASVCTQWSRTDEMMAMAPVRHSDYRDHRPIQLREVYELYSDVVKEGMWTMGLLEMWFWKNKAVKSSVHIPCWDSFKWNPYLWRGACCGRTCEECYWTGIRTTRWSRAVYAANLGREYVFPYQNIGRTGYKSDIKALCWMYCLMGCVFGCGIGQVFSFCGNCLFNFGAFYSCHAREKLRRELRELAVRGVDGPGMHILDVLPNSFARTEGMTDVIAERKQLVDKMVAHPPKFFRSRVKRQSLSLDTVTEVAKKTAMRAIGRTEEDTASTTTAASQAKFGWMDYPAGPPQTQLMSRDSSSSVNAMLHGDDGKPDWAALGETLHGELAPLKRSWSVAY